MSTEQERTKALYPAMLETAEMELDDGARRWGYDPRFPLTYARYGPGSGYQ